MTLRLEWHKIPVSDLVTDMSQYQILPFRNSLVKSGYDEGRGQEEVRRESDPQRPREECSVQKVDVERPVRGATSHGRCCSILPLLKVGGYVILFVHQRV